VIHHRKFETEYKILQGEIVEKEILVQVLKNFGTKFEGKLWGYEDTVYDFQKVGYSCLSMKFFDTEARRNRTG
jgi:hypothetical protein